MVKIFVERRENFLFCRKFCEFVFKSFAVKDLKFKLQLIVD